MLIRVEGGTQAGSKRPKAEKPSKWAHICAAENIYLPGYMAKCFACGTPRPD